MQNDASKSFTGNLFCQLYTYIPANKATGVKKVIRYNMVFYDYCYDYICFNASAAQRRY